MKVFAFCSTVVILFLFSLVCSPASWANQEPLLIEVALGQSVYDEDQISFSNPELSEELSAEYPADLPYGGIFSQLLYKEGTLQWGLDSGFLMGWQNERTSFYASNNQIIITLENELLLFDISMGGFVGLKLGEKLRLFVAAGPQLLIGSVDIDDEHSPEETSSQSTTIVIQESDIDFGWGFYGRAGLQWFYQADSAFGLSYRYYDNALNFEDSFGKVDMKADQYFITFSKFY